MTVNTEENRKSFAGNGTTVDFSTPFFLDDEDLLVLLVTDATGAEDPQILNTEYTVTGAGEPTGGTVTFTTAPASGITVVILVDPPLTQTVDLVNNDALPVDTAVERPMDKLTLIAQRDRDLIERSLRLPDGDTGFVAGDMDLPPKVTRASQFLAFDADGKPIAAAGSVDEVPTTPFSQTLLDDTTADVFVQTLVATLTAETAPATDDTVLLGDTSETAGNKMTLANLLKVLNSLTEDTAPDSAADFLLTYDTSVSGVKKALPVNLYKVGGQIAFPATQVPSADANTLDDYEEGTWTPSVGGTATYTTQTGSYTKIGRSVIFTGFIQINTIGTGSTVTISGLPFANGAANGTTVNIQITASSATAIVSASGLIGVGLQTIAIRSRTAAATADGINAIFGDGAQVFFSGTYHT